MIIVLRLSKFSSVGQNDVSLSRTCHQMSRTKWLRDRMERGESPGQLDLEAAVQREDEGLASVRKACVKRRRRKRMRSRPSSRPTRGGGRHAQCSS